MNKTALHTLLVASSLFAFACNDNKNNGNTNGNDTAVVVENGTHNDMMGNNNGGNTADSQNLIDRAKDALNGNQDSNFVVKATVSNNEELKLLQAGVDMGTDKELKNHARMMIADHKKLGMQVKQFSSNKGYQLPTSDNGKADEALEKLNKNNKGTDWDKEWVDKMVDEHKNDIDMFERAEKNVNDPQLKTMITNALPVLRSHLDMVKNMQDKMKK